MEETNVDFYKYDKHLTEVRLQQSINYPFKDCLITAKLLEPEDSDNSLKNLCNKFIKNGGADQYEKQNT